MTATRVFALSLAIAAAHGAEFDWKLPAKFPRPPVPSDNPMSADKVALGRYLFYDTRLSANGKQSCASCHRQEFAFTDGKARAVGTTGEVHPRGSMSLVNVAYVPLLTWANPGLRTLEEQVLIPMFGENPIELGMKGHEAEFLRAVRDERVYQSLFPKAFLGEASPYTIANVAKAIAAFQRSIISTRSPYDRYAAGDREAISESARRGAELFFSKERAGCSQCHETWTFGAEPIVEGGPEPHVWFRLTGLYDPRDAKAFPPGATGLHQFTGSPRDIGRFRTPPLRNVEVTAPYMHDGSIATLEEVVDHYAAGGRARGAPKHSFVRAFPLTVDEKRDLVEFLKSLTDHEMLRDPRWSDPHVETTTARRR